MFGWVRPGPDAEPVTLPDGRVVPSVFVADLHTQQVMVATDADRGPRIVQLTIGAPMEDDGATAITTEMLNALNLDRLLDWAVEMASRATGPRTIYDDDMPASPPSAKFHRRKKLTDANVSDFIDQYRQTTGTMAERGRQLGYSRASVHRLLGEAVERKIITADERGEI
jgi:hypothetical protein